MNRLRTLELIRLGMVIAGGEVEASVVDEFHSLDVSHLCEMMAEMDAVGVWKQAHEMAGGMRQKQERLGEYFTRRLSEEVGHVRKRIRLQKELWQHQLGVGDD